MVGKQKLRTVSDEQVLYMLRRIRQIADLIKSAEILPNSSNQQDAHYFCRIYKIGRNFCRIYKIGRWLPILSNRQEIQKSS